MAIWLNMTNITTSGMKTTDEPLPSYVTTWPDVEALHTPFASVMKKCNTISQKG